MDPTSSLVVFVGRAQRRHRTLGRTDPTQAGELEPVTDHMKVVTTRNLSAQRHYFIHREFNNSPTAAADHVIVRVLTERVLIMGLLNIEPHLSENAAIHK